MTSQRASGISGAAIVGGVCGAPIKHSMSPLIHNAWIQAAGLDAVGLFLAAWGYNTPAQRDAARRDDRIVLLSLAQFGSDFAAWVH